MPKMLDFIQMSLRGEIPPPPVATLIGVRLKINFLKPVWNAKLRARRQNT